MNVNAPFEWKCEPKAEEILLNALEDCLKKNAQIEKLQNDLLHYTQTRLFDWLDHIVLPYSKKMEESLQQAGFVFQEETASNYFVYHHPRAKLPRVAMTAGKKASTGVAVTVESIADFVNARGGGNVQIEGSPFSGYRRCLIDENHEACLWVVERRGTLTMEPLIESSDMLDYCLLVKEKWLTRYRADEMEERAMQEALALAKEMVKEIGQNRAAWIILECERQYWQIHNTAAQIQKNKQDRLGMGWANHDHHTFRSSRQHFSKLIELFETLGFHCRERYYAGQEAGWGAQVMENPIANLVLFLDVDLSPEEVGIDFAHERLPELPKYGTVGLWCALHGDSILKAGMHHLEAQFMFDELKEGLAKKGVAMMPPFSNFPYLKQAFTQGEMWKVEPKRIEKLRAEGKITKEEAEKFHLHGALGSHLENLQRREGYKGFNQKNVSIIIKETDPRKHS